MKLSAIQVHTAIQVHRSWVLRMTLVLMITCLVDRMVVWYAARPLLWAALIPTTLPLALFFFVALPLLQRTKGRSQDEGPARR